MSATPAPSKLARGAGGLVILLLGLGGGGLVALSPDIAMPLTILLLPGLVALIVDPTPACGMARAMLLFQAAACVHPVSDAWYRCAGINSCMGYLAEPVTVLKVWLAAGVAWIAAQVIPILLKMLDDYRMQHRRVALMERKKVLASEWGMEGEAGS